MKKVFFLLLFLSLSFAQQEWRSVSALAVGIAAIILAVVYAASIVFESQDLRLGVKQDAYELGFTCAILILFFFLAQAIGDISSGIAEFYNISCPAYSGNLPVKHVVCAQNITKKILDGQVMLLSNLVNISRISSQATKTFYCSAILSHINYEPCNGFSVIGGAAAAQAAVLAGSIATTTSQLFLTEITPEFTLLLAIPLGIFLRIFSISRGVAGFLISLGFGLFFAYPVMIIIMYGITNSYELFASSEYTLDLSPNINVDTKDSTFLCEGPLREAPTPYDPAKDVKDAMEGVLDKTHVNYDGIVFLALVRAMFSQGMALLVLISLIAASSKAFGAEIYAFVLAQLERIA